MAPGSGRLTNLSGLGPKRFYKDVDVSEAGRRRFAVTIDGRTVKTPRMTPLELPTLQLATAVAAEWDAQEDRIRPSSMPLTALVSTAKDIIPTFRARVIASTLKYLHTDTVCIRPAYPSELVSFQSKYLDPITQHFERQGIPLNVVLGSLSAPQSAPTADAFRQLVESADHFSLAALESATATAKSLLIAAAMRDGALDAKAALEAARSEELWQSGVWGVVEGGHDMDDADTLVRLSAADLLFRFVEMDPDAFVDENSASAKVER